MQKPAWYELVIKPWTISCTTSLWQTKGGAGRDLLVGTYSINAFISTLSSTRVWIRHRAGTQQQKRANRGQAGKAGQQFWTHQSWVHGGTLMYPPTCPPTRMLRHDVSQECTLTSVTPSHQAIQPHLPTTREGPSLGASFALVSFTLVSFALL